MKLYKDALEVGNNLPLKLFSYIDDFLSKVDDMVSVLA